MPYFKRDTVSLFYTIQGTPTAPPILLLHGWACDSHDWSHQIPLLTSLNFRVIALDHRGHGCSSAPLLITDYSMQNFADDIVALLQHLRLGPVIVIAHSMSTIIASIVAVEHPEVVKALVLAHPIYCGTPPALLTMGVRMQGDPDSAPDLVATFFKSHMYTARTPKWLKTWHTRRVLGMSPAMLAGCALGIIDLFDRVVGQTEHAKMFMRNRDVPRLVVATNSLPSAAAWEEELGLSTSDKLCIMEEGTFSHFVENEKFNGILEDWLKRESFV